VKGFRAILRKEAIQMARDEGTLRFAIAVPIFQLCLFGVIDTNVKHVPTVVYDQSRTVESRSLIRDFENTATFDVKRFARSRAEMREEIVAGRVATAIEIPPDYADRRARGVPADVLVMIDGSDANTSGQALSAANGVALSHSIEELLARTGGEDLPLRVFPQILFNPDSRSANLLIPGLVAILLTFSGTVLAAFSIVKERERGTLEQLMVTPVSPVGLVLGKLIPYLALGFLQLIAVLAIMTTVFRVPIHGNIFLLLGLSVAYLFALICMALVVSASAATQIEAMQRAQAFLLPSIMLSGYVFPLSSLPEWLRVVAQVLPATHFIAISRGIIIRGAGFADLWPHVAALLIISALLVLASTRAFRKTLA